jgi:hypothetical protein
MRSRSDHPLQRMGFMHTTYAPLTEAVAQKLLDTMDHGLVSGLGNPRPGQMCVEAAVCYALGLPHGDLPPCVGDAVRTFKIRLNDARWSSNQARARGMRKLAIAHLGSDTIDQAAFTEKVTEGVIRLVVSLALRDAARVHHLAEHREALEAAAVRCQDEGTRDAAQEACTVARAAAAAAAAVADATSAAIAAYATDAADAADPATAAHAAACAHAAYATDAAARRDAVLRLVAEIGLEALIDLQSRGCEWLYLVS